MDEGRRQALYEAFRTLANELQQEYGFSEDELRRAIAPSEENIPATAFDNELTPFETAARWLTEHGNTPEETAKTLGRPPSVIKKTLANSKQKRPAPLAPTPTEHAIPAGIFSDKTYTFSEHVARHLKGRGLTNAEIARTTGQDPRTVWTLLKRAEEKSGGEEQ